MVAAGGFLRGQERNKGRRWEGGSRGRGHVYLWMIHVDDVMAEIIIIL